LRGPHPEERALARVSKDGRALVSPLLSGDKPSPPSIWCPICKLIWPSGHFHAAPARKSVAPKTEICEPDQTDLPSPVPQLKIFLFSFDPNQIHNSRHPVPHEGRFAIVTDVGTGCGGRGCALDEQRSKRTEKSCGPDASTPASSSRKATSAGDGDKQARSPGRARRKPLKPLRGESRIASAGPVCSCAFLFAHFAHETAGAARTRLSLRPLISESGKLIANLARNTRRDRGITS
jgi:hypothetical protein